MIAFRPANGGLISTGHADPDGLRDAEFQDLKGEVMKVFSSCEALEIYPNACGGVTLRQECPVGGDPAHIAIPLHHIERTIRVLRDMADAAADMNDEGRDL